MNQDEINEVHKLLLNHFIEKGFKPSQLMGFVTATFIGQMALSGYSDDFIDKTCDRIKDKIKTHVLRK